MATINLLHNVGDTVYHVSAVDGVHEAVVKQIDVAVKYLLTEISYTVQLVKTKDIVESEEPMLYADVDAALAAYKLLITA